MEENKVLDTSVLIAGNNGITTIFNIIEYPSASEKCSVIWPKREDYAKALAIAAKLRKAGRPVGAVDIIIASICINRGLVLVSRDEDFNVIREVDPALKLEKG
jgi:hypothetical protein